MEKGEKKEGSRERREEKTLASPPLTCCISASAAVAFEAATVPASPSAEDRHSSTARSVSRSRGCCLSAAASAGRPAEPTASCAEG